MVCIKRRVSLILFSAIRARGCRCSLGSPWTSGHPHRSNTFIAFPFLHIFFNEFQHQRADTGPKPVRTVTFIASPPVGYHLAPAGLSLEKARSLLLNVNIQLQLHATAQCPTPPTAPSGLPPVAAPPAQQSKYNPATATAVEIQSDSLEEGTALSDQLSQYNCQLQAVPQKSLPLRQNARPTAATDTFRIFQ
jgi:hypothetical protein